MNIKNERGITLTMLIITVIVMLIIATILIYFSVGDNSLLTNAQNTKFEEEMGTIKSRVDEKIVTKQNIEGKTTGVTLSETEQKDILGSYYDNGLTVNENGELKYTSSGNFTDHQKEILEKIGINKE